MSNGGKPRIVVLGGGFGGLEAAFYLRMRLRDRAHLTLVSDQDRFLFKPNTIYIPFGLDPERLMISLEKPARARNITFLQGRAREIDTANKQVLVDGQRLPYDFLIIATGAGMRAAEVPGLENYARTIWTPQDMLGLRTAFADLLDRAQAGRQQRVLFLVPPNNKCSGP
ncbi:MAG TPA: FAD-dependent oxidoreductase, partial [bacterium]|nr:FAD-dependent oxidoreductase [bacterium]